MCPEAMDSWYYKAAVPLLFSHSHESCFCQDNCLWTNLWTKWGNGSILRNTLPKWGGVVFFLVLTESDPAFWNWVSISKLIHSVAPEIVVLKNQRGQWAKGGMRINSWDWMNEVYLKFIFMSNIFYYETFILRVQFVICDRRNQLRTSPIFSVGVCLFTVGTRI